MLIEQRHQAILDILHKQGSIKAREIERKFNIGFDTARRDLRILEEKGLLKRTHGGAIPLVQVGHHAPEPSGDLAEVKTNYLAIAQEAVKCIQNHDVVFLACGAENLFLAQSLPADLSCTIATNSIAIAQALKDHDKISVYVIGGLMSQKGHMANHFAVDMIRQMHFDVSFLAAEAFSVPFGMSTQNGDMVPVYQAVVESSRKSIGLFPHDKMGNRSILKVCPPSDFSVVITDWETTEEAVANVKELGIDVMVADQHEVVYKKLKAKGYRGWGGSKYEERMKGWEEKVKRLFETVPLENGSILELGCGAGDASFQLADRGHRVTGVDISPTAIEWAKEKAASRTTHTDFLVGSVCEQDLLEGRVYDVVMDGCCLHCLFGEDRVAFYRNVRRLLHRDGYFFVNSAILNKDGDQIPQLSSIERCVMTEDALESELTEMGFEKVASWVNAHAKHSHYSAVYRKTEG